MIGSHAPEGYVCPFCGLVNGDVSDPDNRCELEDLVYQDEDVIVFIAVSWLTRRSEGATIDPDIRLVMEV